MNKDEFIATYGPAAQRVATQLNVPQQGVLNHWGLETGWGKSVIPGTNNLGNIKDFSGGGVAATDNMTKTRDRYRQYATVDDFANDYAKLIGNNKRYAAALNTNTAYDFANGLQQGGYAEDPNFARKVAGMPLLANSMNAYGVPYSDASLGEVKSKKIDPQALAALEEMNTARRSVLPMAMGAMLSPNAGTRNFGNNMYAYGIQGMSPTKLAHGMILPDGQYLTDDDSEALKLASINANNAVRQQTIDTHNYENEKLVDPLNPWNGMRRKDANPIIQNSIKDAQKQIDDWNADAKTFGERNQKLDRFSELNRETATGSWWDRATKDLPIHTGNTDQMNMITKQLNMGAFKGQGSVSNFERGLADLMNPSISHYGNDNAAAIAVSRMAGDVAQSRAIEAQRYLAAHQSLNGFEDYFARDVLPQVQQRHKAAMDFYNEKTGGAKRRDSQVSNQPQVGLPKSKAAASGGFSIEPAGN